MSDEGIALAYDDVTFRYPGSRGDVLSGVSMAVPAGAFALLVGGTGSGKSTLLSLAKPQIAPAGDRVGQVRVFGRPVDDLDGAEACEVGYVFQDPDNQIVCDSVWHEMAFGLENLGTPQGEMRRRVAEASYFFGMGPWFHSDTDALSGGRKQLLALASTLVMQPRVLLLDEPLSNLDAKLRNQMRAEIIKLRSRINTTFVYVTHDQTEAMTLGDRIVIMRDGFIQQIGTPQEVFDHPKNLFVAGFIGTPQMNFFPDAKLTVKDGKYVVELLGKSIVLPEDKQAALRARKQPEGTVTVGVRPVHLSLHQEGFPATIDVSEMMGSEMHLHMTVSGHDVIAVIPTAGLSLDDVRAGGTAHFTFDPELMHLFDPKTEENLFPVENSKAKV